LARWNSRHNKLYSAVKLGFECRRPPGSNEKTNRVGGLSRRLWFLEFSSRVAVLSSVILNKPETKKADLCCSRRWDHSLGIHSDKLHGLGDSSKGRTNPNPVSNHVCGSRGQTCAPESRVCFLQCRWLVFRFLPARPVRRSSIENKNWRAIPVGEVHPARFDIR